MGRGNVPVLTFQNFRSFAEDRCNNVGEVVWKIIAAKKQKVREVKRLE